MYVQNLDTTDPAALEAALEAAPLDTLGQVTVDGQTHNIQRVTGGWYLPGDVVVTSGDVADGRPDAVSLLRDEDYRGEDPYDERDWADTHWNSGTAVVVEPWERADDEEDDQ
ncbi:hypothetical protein GCM10009798_23240 [Nocardioides panacihumi]|uniref:Uncharacterized protein n=1 Tax=Nocardioides panacihumi TaxID=400774 RepID=A0ABP5CEL8_9ACTN